MMGQLKGKRIPRNPAWIAFVQVLVSLTLCPGVSQAGAGLSTALAVVSENCTCSNS